MTSTLTPAERVANLTDLCEHVETRAELEKKLATGRRLRVKLGLDPTSPDLHIGHAVVLRKLQQFVEDGHDVTLLIGDFTARIGDPSGRNSLRPPLTGEQIEANMQTYAQQAGKVVDLARVTTRYNSEWLAPLTLVDLIKLLSQTTVARMLERDDFSKRYASGTPISLHEFLYPVAQAYDSVALQADVELGGSDQLFNLLMGRPYQQHHGQEPQVCLTTPLLEGLDGQKKMSKSLGNHIGLTDPPEEMFGKVMRIGDELLTRYARLAVFRSAADVAELERGLSAGRLQPMDEKKRIAEELVVRYHGADAGRAARDYFERTVQRREVVVTREQPWGGEKTVSDLVAAVYGVSKREAKSQVAQGAVRLDGATVEDPTLPWPADGAHVIQWGTKRPAVRITPA